MPASLGSEGRIVRELRLRFPSEARLLEESESGQWTKTVVGDLEIRAARIGRRRVEVAVRDGRVIEVRVAVRGSPPRVYVLSPQRLWPYTRVATRAKAR